jgi:tyrosyl-tRNA synthetase
MRSMSIDEQIRYLMQGTEYGDQELKQKMAMELKERLISAKRANRPLRVYCGFDPRTSDLHIGHTVPIRKLRQFQELGHEVIFLVGTYTALVGDPSDKDEGRKLMAQEKTIENAKTYAKQACKILDIDKTQIRYNHEWLSKLSFRDVIDLASNFTLQQFLTRENFKLRWEKGEAVYLHETFYALMQGYDAYTLKADVQVGGTDQLFNIITVSRRLMTALGMQPNVAIITGILPGTDGEIKMSKSLGNHIAILASPEDMYGKVMSIPDTAIHSYFVTVTRLRPHDIDGIMRGMEEGKLCPRDVKMRLAREIVAIFYSADEAKRAEAEFVRVFRKNESPEGMPEYHLHSKQTLLDVLTESGLVSTRSEGRRLIQQRGVRLDGEIVTDSNTPLAGKRVLLVGKRRFIRLINLQKNRRNSPKSNSPAEKS